MNFWLELVLKVAVVLILVLTSALVVIYAELKAGSHMQGRIGPYYAGGRWGWAAPLADGAKFLQKEDLAPALSDRTVYGFAPYVVMMSTLSVFAVIPLGPDMVAVDLDLGVYFVLAISSLSVLGVLMAGWSSANKYSLIGGLRAAAQLITGQRFLPARMIAADQCPVFVEAILVTEAGNARSYIHPAFFRLLAQLFRASHCTGYSGALLQLIQQGFPSFAVSTQVTISCAELVDIRENIRDDFFQYNRRLILVGAEAGWRGGR